MIASPKTKIIATLGPSVSSPEMMEKLFLNGVDIFRINFSHSSHQTAQENIDIINDLNKKYNKRAAILGDLQGPKLRIGDVENDCVFLESGDEVCFVSEPCLGTKEHLYMSYQNLPKDVKKGEFILVDDGKIKLGVVDTNGKDKVTTKVIYGGFLSSKKGVNLPNTAISLPGLTEKDISDAQFAVQAGISWIGLSFVRKAADVKPLRELIHKYSKSVHIIAKIEKPEALTHLDEIINISDGIMVARGDLGVEVPFDQVPMIQKDIVRKCRFKAKPVIIATQMLESMITNFRPTRAEANDVANAVMDGADAIMLSGETSTGKFPIEAVEAMKRIALWTEKNGFSFNKNITVPDVKDRFFLRDSVCFNAFHMAKQVDAKAIVAFTHSGYTANRIASYRPKANVYVFTNNPHLTDKMKLIWGSHTFFFNKTENTDEAVKLSIQMLKDKQLLLPNDIVIHIGSMPVEMKGAANMIRLSKV